MSVKYISFTRFPIYFMLIIPIAFSVKVVSGQEPDETKLESVVHECEHLNDSLHQIGQSKECENETPNKRPFRTLKRSHAKKSILDSKTEVDEQPANRRSLRRVPVTRNLLDPNLDSPSHGTQDHDSKSDDESEIISLSIADLRGISDRTQRDTLFPKKMSDRLQEM